MSTRDYFMAVLISLGVAAELVCCLGVLAMRNALDRLHYAAAANTLGPMLIAVAVCVREGVATNQGLTALLIAFLMLVAGPAVTSATARVVRLHERGTLDTTQSERDRGSP
jgi:monovalent cation/proton antiporter MnhG/PhaG subunit